MVRGYLPAIDENGSRVMLLTFDYSPLDGSPMGANGCSKTPAVRGPQGEVLLAESDGMYVDLCGRRYRMLRSGHAEVQTITNNTIAEPS